MKTKASLYPQKINEDVWYYEEDHKLTLVHAIYHNNEYIRTDLISIPKYKLNKSLKRMNMVIKEKSNGN